MDKFLMWFLKIVVGLAVLSFGFKYGIESYSLLSEIKPAVEYSDDSNLLLLDSSYVTIDDFNISILNMSDEPKAACVKAALKSLATDQEYKSATICIDNITAFNSVGKIIKSDKRWITDNCYNKDLFDKQMALYNKAINDWNSSLEKLKKLYSESQPSIPFSAAMEILHNKKPIHPSKEFDWDYCKFNVELLKLPSKEEQND